MTAALNDVRREITVTHSLGKSEAFDGSTDYVS